MKTSRAEFFFIVGKFPTINSIFSIKIGYSDYLFFLMSFGNLCLSRNFSISPKLLNKSVHNIPYYLLLTITISSLLSLILVTCYFSPFHLVNLATDVSIVLIFSKNQLFISLFFSNAFLTSISLVIFFLLPAFGLICLRWKLK